MAQKANLDISEKLDITCRRGDSFELTLNIKDSASVALPLSTDKYTFFFQIKSVSRVRTSNPSISPSRRTLIAGSTLAESPTGGENVETEATTSIFTFQDKDDLGNVTLKATAEATSRLPVGRFTYDLQYQVTVNGFAKTTTILRGSFVVKEDISTAV
tara:strand:- start:581 stop:1054 length:474 start_codon:yes stop_codon:yes gene_type:complete